MGSKKASPCKLKVHTMHDVHSSRSLFNFTITNFKLYANNKVFKDVD
jgi:hypothetical protein